MIFNDQQTQQPIPIPTTKKWRWLAAVISSVVLLVATFTVIYPVYSTMFEFVFGIFGISITTEWANAHLVVMFAVLVGIPALIAVGLACALVRARNVLVVTGGYKRFAAIAERIRAYVFSDIHMEQALSLLSFALGLGALYFLLGIGSAFDTEEEMTESMGFALLIPIDPLLLAVAIPSIVFGTICRKKYFEFDGWAQAGRIISIICVILSFTKVGFILPLMVNGFATVIWPMLIA
jgi:uncharacterized protein (DUF697 family)